MWLGARGNGSGDYIWQQQQKKENQGLLAGNSSLWGPRDPGPNHLSSEYCLVLAVHKDDWNTAPVNPYAAKECSHTAYTLCEGKLHTALTLVQHNNLYYATLLLQSITYWNTSILV